MVVIFPVPLLNELLGSVVGSPTNVGFDAMEYVEDHLALLWITKALTGREQRLHRMYADSVIRSAQRDANNLAAVFLAGRQDGLIRVQAFMYRGASLGRLVRLVHEQLDLAHVVALHGRGAHGNAVPDLREEGVGLSDCRGASGLNASGGLEGQRQPIVPDLELALKEIPVVEH